MNDWVHFVAASYGYPCQGMHRSASISPPLSVRLYQEDYIVSYWI